MCLSGLVLIVRGARFYSVMPGKNEEEAGTFNVHWFGAHQEDEAVLLLVTRGCPIQTGRDAGFFNSAQWHGTMSTLKC